ncbi:RNA polymerase sigma factor [Sphingobium sp. TCM1]|uniref:RNA polymerase sigma factor n=1 Tax=Sphingobium sp. TCM1 TaxID=453246 RepID=UPI0007F539B2|nr:sigma-70 region 4 domain-containing protein [Sphingobium sp. TCM1]OAN53499.1 hypothetical protein A7Q26_05620 [Sphingobium sp. TCM1]
MPDHDARALLAEALDFFNDHPRFSLRRDRRRNSYDLASRIEACLSAVPGPPGPVIAVARDRWASSGFLRVDADEHIVTRDAQGYWVRAWVRIDPASVGEIDPVTAKRYARALAALPDLTRSVLLAHQQDGQSITQIAERLGLTTQEVERHITDALTRIGRAIGQG